MKLSVIIPTLNEAANIERALRSVSREFEGEIIVVDGGSQDETVEKARRLRVRVLESSPGLATQCNFGVELSSGQILLFLSGDCELVSGWYGALEEALKNPEVVGGGFRLCLDSALFQARLVEWGGNFRSFYRKVALSDQALFARRDSFMAAGGFQEPSRVPHALLSLELQKLGKMKILRHPVLSSPRKWNSNGYLKTVYEHAKTFRGFLRHETGGRA